MPRSAALPKSVLMPKPRRLKSSDEKTARMLANPANFSEIVLGIKLYPKQRQALEACEEPGWVSIAAANGMGKTRCLIPTLVLWHQTVWPGGIVKVTSGSYPQIEDQVWPAIVEHKDKFPGWKWYETPYLESRDPITGHVGFVRCFTTNEPGRFEGQHSLGPDRPLMIIVDEAKSAPEWMRQVAEARIRPERLVLLSSHGFSEGWFYESQTSLAERP
jgi:phage terminase large subunit